MTKEPNPGKGNIGGGYTILDDAGGKAAAARKRAQERFICESVIEDDDDPDAVAGALRRLAELDEIEKKAG